MILGSVVNPKKDFTCPTTIVTAIPAVKPVVIVYGMNLIRLPNFNNPIRIRIIPARIVATIKPFIPFFATIPATIVAKAAVGVDKDGMTIYLAVVDGGNYFYSNGITNSDMAQLMKGCGAANAMILNTGNNVSAFTRDEDSIDLFTVINKPSNDGLEAAIGNGLMILQL